MSQSRFVYVTYIRTTPQKLWDALTLPEFTRQYWSGTHQVSAWKAGASWKAMIPDGRVADAGEILESDPPRRLVLTWENQFLPEFKAEGPSRLTYEIEPHEMGVKLTLTHEMDAPGAKLIDAVSQGWPGVIASLKSLLETGTALAGSDKWPDGM